MEELLRMEHISKRFGNFYANHDVNFSVAKGEVLFAPEAIWWAMPLTELVTSVYAAYAMRKSLTGLCTN